MVHSGSEGTEMEIIVVSSVDKKTVAVHSVLVFVGFLNDVRLTQNHVQA